MKTIINFLLNLIKIILGITNLIIIIIIILNILYLLSTKVLKSEYPAFLDYTFFIVDTDDSYLNLNKDDLLIIDLRKEITTEELFFYKDSDGFKIGKITNIDNTLTIKDGTKEANVNQEAVAGKVVKNIPNIGKIINELTKPMILLISVVILIITSFIQSLITKRLAKTNQKKPNFNQNW